MRNIGLGLFHERIFHRKFDAPIQVLIVIDKKSDRYEFLHIATLHDRCTVVARAKFHSDIIAYNGITLKPIFHRILIMIGKSFVKWAPGPELRIARLSLLVAFYRTICSKNFTYNK